MFDLDDTLYNEVDYLISAYWEIIHVYNLQPKTKLHSEMLKWYYDGNDVFKLVINKYKINATKSDLIKIYREHIPSINLFEDASALIRSLNINNVPIALITDGRSITQRNKIKALGLSNLFTNLIISEEINTEKPSLNNFEMLVSRDYTNYVYIADNPKKDFLSPNVLGWVSICLLNNGRNIHKQDFNLPFHYLPKYKIKSFAEINLRYE